MDILDILLDILLKPPHLYRAIFILCRNVFVTTCILCGILTSYYLEDQCNWSHQRYYNSTTTFVVLAASVAEEEEELVPLFVELVLLVEEEDLLPECESPAT